MPWASTYSATKFGLRGLTESLRHELADQPGIHVRRIYPGIIDTPTFIHSGNYSGHELRPVPPVSDPAEVAREVVGLARRPRRAVGVGMAPKLAIPYALAPELTGRLMARFGARFLRAGLLFEPMVPGVTEHGGWQAARRERAGGGLAIGLLAAGAVAFAIGVMRSGRARRAVAG